MQILQWLFKTAMPESPKTAASSTSTSPKLKHGDEGEKTRSEKAEVVIVDGGRRRRRRLKGVEKSTKLSCDDMILLRFMQRKDVSKPLFYHTLNLKGLGCFFDRSRSSEKTRRKRSEEVAGVVGGNRVLPVADQPAAQCSLRKRDGRFLDSGKRDGSKKSGTISVSSRVKELLKWSATAKVINFKNESTSEAMTDDHQVNDESPKISFRLEMESCSTISNADLQAEMGNWITTDSEFVVLEL